MTVESRKRWVGRAARHVGVGLFGCVVLAWVVLNATPRGTVVVHVVEPDVDVRVGGERHHVEGRVYTPIICRLPRGRHELVMTRGGVVLHRQEFLVEGGKELVLTAWTSIPEKLLSDRR